MKNSKDTKMFTENIKVEGAYQDIKGKINLESVPELPKNNSHKTLFLYIASPLLAVSIVAVVLGVALYKKSHKDDPQDIFRAVSHTLIEERHIDVDTFGVDISPVDNSRRDVGRFMQSEQDIDTFISDYLISDSSGLYSDLKALDDTYFSSKSLAILAVYKLENFDYSFLDLGVIRNASGTLVNLAATIKQKQNASSDVSIYVSMIEIDKGIINKLEYPLTSNNVYQFFGA